MANSKALLGVRVVAAPARLLCSFLRPSSPGTKSTPRCYSVRCSLEPPDVPRLAETARISLTPKEVEDFAPKIRQTFVLEPLPCADSKGLGEEVGLISIKEKGKLVDVLWANHFLSPPLSNTAGGSVMGLVGGYSYVSSLVKEHTLTQGVHSIVRFGQLQAVDLESIEPALRADTEVGGNLRADSAVTFENREALLAAVPSYDEPYINVPKVLNKE